MFCWVALDRGARLARRRGEDALEEKWRGVADEIHADICANGVDERGVFTQFYGTDALDASLLLMPLVRFLPRDDQRIRATVLAIADELTMDGLVLRYRVEQTDDGLSGEEGTFTICSFWLVSALVEIGELPRARALCEKLLSLASPLQLYAEEIDAVTGRHLGNSQAFTHLALINAVVHDPGGDADAARLLDGAPDRHLMRALVAAPGAPGGIEPRDVDEPVPANGVAVVEVRACSLNRGECAALLIAEDGWRPGWDVAGAIAEPALDGSTPPAGTRVTAWASGGGWAERVAVRSGHLAPIPDDLSFESASTLPVAGLTALGTLAFGGSLEGTSVAITGAAGGVGRFAVQLAHQAGAKVTAVVGNPERGEGLPRARSRRRCRRPRGGRRTLRPDPRVGRWPQPQRPRSPACRRTGPSCRSGTRRTSPRRSTRVGSPPSWPTSRR